MPHLVSNTCSCLTYERGYDIPPTEVLASHRRINWVALAEANITSCSGPSSSESNLLERIPDFVAGIQDQATTFVDWIYAKPIRETLGLTLSEVQALVLYATLQHRIISKR
jgi:hypothetical protein